MSSYAAHVYVTNNFPCILFASRYPTSPSEGGFLYDCLKERLQTEETLAHFELEAAITGTCKPPF